MRTFIFTKNMKNEHGKLIRVIVGMTQSEFFPSSARNEGGEFEGCDIIEVSDHCHIELGVLADRF